MCLHVKSQEPPSPLLSLWHSHSPLAWLSFTVIFYLLPKCCSASVPTLMNTEGGRLPFKRKPTQPAQPLGWREARPQPPCQFVKMQESLLLWGPSFIWFDSFEEGKPLNFSGLGHKGPLVHSTDTSVRCTWQIRRKATQQKQASKYDFNPQEKEARGGQQRGESKLIAVAGYTLIFIKKQHSKYLQ